MKKVLYILFIFIVTLSLSNKVYAESCDREDINRLKEIAKNVEIKYELLPETENYEGDIIKNSYNIIISKLSDEIYFKISDTDYLLSNSTYYYDDSTNGEIILEKYISKNYLIDFYSTRCEQKLLSKKLNLNYIYDNYNKSNICKEYKDKIIECGDEYIEDMTEKELIKKIDEYKDSKKSKYKIKYIYYIAFGIILIIILLFFKIRRKSGKNEK